MPAVRVMDVAEAIRDRFFEVTGKRVEIRISGLGRGKKLHEELVFAYKLKPVGNNRGIYSLFTRNINA